MKLLHDRLRTLAALAAGIMLGALPALAQDEKFETLVASGTLYSNVTVLNKTRTDLFIKHAHGMANLKVKDLDTATQLRLGYQVEQPKPSKTALLAPDLAALESDPRVQDLQTKLAEEATKVFEELDPRILYGVIAGFVLLYLFFCFCCRSICVKAGKKPSPLIWLPLLKQIPLLKAAGMSPAWILANLVPVLPLIIFIVWCFKIAHARGKSAFVGFLLLLPVLNVLAFLYLAFSEGFGDDSGSSNRNVITLQGNPRREAA